MGLLSLLLTIGVQVGSKWKGIRRVAVPVIVAATVALVGVGALIGVSWKNPISPERAFLVSFVLLCALSFAALPGFSTADEAHHFLRSYGIAHGAFVEDEPNPSPEFASGKVPNQANAGMLAVGDYFPGNLLPYASDPPTLADYSGLSQREATLSSIARSWDVSLSADWEFYGFANTALYSPVSYLPQAAGIAVADLFTDRSWLLYYAARLMVIVSYGALVYAAIRLIPMAKSVVVLLALSPRSLAEVNSVSADPFVFALCLLVVALVLRARAEDKLLGPRQVVVLCLVVCGIALCKMVYLPVAFAVLLIPAKLFGRGGRLVKAGIVILACAANLAWLAVSAGILDGVAANPGVDARMQLLGMASNPLGFASAVGATLLDELVDWIVGMLATSYYWGAVRPVMALLPLPWIVMLVAWLSDRASDSLAKGVRLAFGAVFLIVFALVITSIYLQYNAVGAQAVAGVQGRYFLPVALMALLAVQPKGPARFGLLERRSGAAALYCAYLVIGVAFLYDPLSVALS